MERISRSLDNEILVFQTRLDLRLLIMQTGGDVREKSNLDEKVVTRQIYLFLRQCMDKLGSLSDSDILDPETMVQVLLYIVDASQKAIDGDLDD